MRDANGRSHRPAGMPGAGRFESEADDSDLDVEPTPGAVPPPEEPESEPEPRHGWGDYLSTAALTTAVTAVGVGVLFGIARLGTVLAGWISTLPHPGVIVGVGGAALLIGLLSLDPRLRK